MKANLVVQVRLRSPNLDGTYAERTCLIDNAKVRTGSKVTLRNSDEPARRWEVIWKSAAFEPGDSTWKVGGL